MGAELYFIKLNKEMAKTELSALIKNNNDFSYKQFLSDNHSRYGKDVQFDSISSLIDENIEQVTEEALWSLFDWFNERFDKSGKKIDYHRWVEQLNEEMCPYGLDLFYEIPSKTPVRNFHHLLSDYECLTNKDLDNSCDANELRGFLNYVICYSGELEIFLNKHYYEKNENCEDNLEIRQKIYEINSTTDNYFHKLAIAELEQFMEYNIETLHLLPPVIEFRRANQGKPEYSLPEEFYEIKKRESDLLDLGVMYEFASEIIEKLGNYDGKVARLHSY